MSNVLVFVETRGTAARKFGLEAVTAARAFADATGYAIAQELRSDARFEATRAPAAFVSWIDAVRYAQWLARETGKPYRLVRDAEYEKAARGGLKAKTFPWGDNPPETLPDYADRWKTGPDPVGRAAPNEFGLFNMCDNVHEWCSDWYAPDYYAVSPERNPRGPETGGRRSSRGGSWRHHIKISRCATRSSISPDFKYHDYGFRVACDV